MSHTTPTAEAIRTTVGCAGVGDNYFKGHALIAELAGVASASSLMSMAIDGPPLDETSEVVLDYLAAVNMVPDPRIWPFKICRLASSYGSPLVAQGIARLAMESSFLGANAVAGAARMIVDAVETLGERIDDDDAVDDYVARCFETMDKLPGFGVVARERDERDLALDDWYTRYADGGGPFWHASRRLIAAAERLRGLHPNVGQPWAAVLLDLGYDPMQVKMLVMRDADITLSAVAWEGIAQQSAGLRRLDDRYSNYTGAAPRSSPRAGGTPSK